MTRGAVHLLLTRSTEDTCMRIALFLSALACVAACDSPSPSMWGAEATRHTVDGATFSVRVRDDRAEAIRIGWDGRIRRAPMVARGGAAIEAASGCRVDRRSLRGDTNIVSARLICD